MTATTSYIEEAELSSLCSLSPVRILALGSIGIYRRYFAWVGSHRRVFISPPGIGMSVFRIIRNMSSCSIVHAGLAGRL
uniref:DUF4338 domain-containing protein n=1 Tax=Steinernema glaseri TaxID=37863 RepID=A0A1I8A5V8_9BILA